MTQVVCVKHFGPLLDERLLMISGRRRPIRVLGRPRMRTSDSRFEVVQGTSDGRHLCEALERACDSVGVGVPDL